MSQMNPRNTSGAGKAGSQIVTVESGDWQGAQLSVPRERTKA